MEEGVVEAVLPLAVMAVDNKEVAVVIIHNKVVVVEVGEDGGEEETTDDGTIDFGNDELDLDQEPGDNNPSPYRPKQLEFRMHVDEMCQSNQLGLWSNMNSICHLPMLTLVQPE
jgi:hypothetical protein